MNFTPSCEVYTADCFAWFDAAPQQSVDLIVTDPPYGMAYQSNRRVRSDKFRRIANDNGLDWVPSFFEESYRVLKPNSAMYTFCSWHHIDTFKVNFQKHFTLKNVLVWVKNNHGSGDLTGAYAPKHEFILYGHKGRSLIRNGRRPDVLEFPKVASNNMVHPTEKPIPLLLQLIQASSDPGDTVLDPFCGSGTTGVACVESGRNFIGVELDPGYATAARSRVLQSVNLEAAE